MSVCTQHSSTHTFYQQLHNQSALKAQWCVGMRECGNKQHNQLSAAAFFSAKVLCVNRQTANNQANL